jgi:hypothetical protein
MSDLPPMVPSAEERAQELMMGLGKHELPPSRITQVGPKTTSYVSGYIGDAFRDGVLAERKHICKLLAEPDRGWIKQVAEGQAKMRPFNATMVYYDDIERILRAVAALIAEGK